MKRKFQSKSFSVCDQCVELMHEYRCFNRFLLQTVEYHHSGNYGSVSFHDKEINAYNLTHKSGDVYAQFLIPKPFFFVRGHIRIITDLETYKTSVYILNHPQ
jgi:hypothetical protein